MGRAWQQLELETLYFFIFKIVTFTLRGVTAIDDHRQLIETLGDGFKAVKNVRSWVQQFKEGRTSCGAIPYEQNRLPKKSPQWPWNRGEDYKMLKSSGR